MPAKFLVVDDRGQFWQEDSFDLRARNHGLTAGSSFLDYALRNLGFVAIRHLKCGAFEVRFRPRSVMETALIAAVYILWDKAPSRIVLTIWTTNGWQSEICPEADKFFGRIATLLKHERSREPRRVLQRQRTAASLPADHCFRRIIDIWAAASEVNDETYFLRQIAEAADNRYMLFERDPISGFTVRAFGSNQPSYALKWLRDSNQKAIHLQPDCEYAWSCETAYSDALLKRRPVLDDIDANVQWRTDNGLQALRRRYSRLLLPFRVGSNDRLLNVTREDTSIDLMTASNVVF